MKREFSAYPLFVKDPFFSIWADNENINKTSPIFWVGNKKILNGYIIIGDKKMVFLGESDGSFEQLYIKTEGFTTECSFTSDILDLTVQFISPLFLDDLDVLSCPVCYLKYDVKLKKEIKDARICFEAEERIAYDTAKNEERKEETAGSVIDFGTFESAVIGLKRQLNLSYSQDEVGADWGYWHIAGETCAIEEREGRKYACATNSLKEQGFFMIGMDDVVSVNYFGRMLTGYYFRDGKTFCDAMQDAYDHAKDIFRRCDEYNHSYIKEWSKLGEEYVTLCNASLIQTIGAHKLVKDYESGDVLFLSHECGSCGCMATLDVTYPSSPLFLKYNPELVRCMLYPIFEFAHKKLWIYPFAPHDVGMFPLAYGQVYGLRHEGNKYRKGQISYEEGLKTVLRVYMEPVNKEHYDFKKQMPVEESSNVLILLYAAYLCDGKTELIKKESVLLKQWSDYILEQGTHLQKQLCTDDFCGRKANNINLSIKSALGLYAFSKLCEVLGEDGSKYLRQAEAIASHINSIGETFEHLPATFDDKDDTYSLKYNLAFDLFFGSQLFHADIFRKEAECYQKNLRKYGVRLYSDINTTKSDWMAFVSCFKDDKEYRKLIYDSINRHMQETVFRLPFVDWYDVDDPNKREACIFRNRTVQGGVFMPLLIK